MLNASKYLYVNEWNENVLFSVSIWSFLCILQWTPLLLAAEYSNVPPKCNVVY